MLFDLNPSLKPRQVKLEGVTYDVPRPNVEQEMRFRGLLRRIAMGEETALQELFDWFAELAPDLPPVSALPGSLVVRLGTWLCDQDAEDVCEGNASGAAG